MTTMSPTLPRVPRPTLTTDVDVLHDMAERLNGQPVPGVRMTERQFVEWCTEQMQAEWVDGEVILVPFETPGHNKRELRLGTILEVFVDHHELGDVFVGTVPVRLPGHRRRRVPDVVFVAAARSHLIDKTVIDGAPDLLVEIVSPDSVTRDWVDKLADYEKAGVREYWIADARHERFVAYGLHGKKYRPIQPDDEGRVHSRVLKGLYIRPAWLWQTPLPKVATILRELGVR